MKTTGADTTPRSSFRTCNVRVDAMDLNEAVDRLLSLAVDGVSGAVHLCNAYTLSLAAGDANYASVIDRGDLNLTDGMPLAWIGRRLGLPVDTRRRPRGVDVFVRTIAGGQDQGVRHYLYGGTPEVVNALDRRLRAVAPRADIVGVESPPFRPLSRRERTELIERVRASGAHMVWVGLGTPKQDHFVDELRDELGAVLIAVGAAFDFLAGAKREAPSFVRSFGLEWLFRFASEPRRLWKRYLIGNARFVIGVIRTRARAT